MKFWIDIPGAALDQNRHLYGSFVCSRLRILRTKQKQALDQMHAAGSHSFEVWCFKKVKLVSFNISSGELIVFNSMIYVAGYQMCIIRDIHVIPAGFSPSSSHLSNMFI